MIFREFFVAFFMIFLRERERWREDGRWPVMDLQVVVGDKEEGRWLLGEAK